MRLATLVDRDVDHGLVEQLVGDLAEGHRPEDAAGAPALELAVQVVEHAVAGEHGLADVRRDGCHETIRIVVDGLGCAVGDAFEDGRIEAQLASGDVGRLDADVELRPAAIRDQG
jgi:hypothetical protein